MSAASSPKFRALARARPNSAPSAVTASAPTYGASRTAARIGSRGSLNDAKPRERAVERRIGARLRPDDEGGSALESAATSPRRRHVNEAQQRKLQQHRHRIEVLRAGASPWHEGRHLPPRERQRRVRKCIPLYARWPTRRRLLQWPGGSSGLAVIADESFFSVRQALDRRREGVGGPVRLFRLVVGPRRRDVTGHHRDPLTVWRASQHRIPRRALTGGPVVYVHAQGEPSTGAPSIVTPSAVAPDGTRPLVKRATIRSRQGPVASSASIQRVAERPRLLTGVVVGLTSAVISLVLVWPSAARPGGRASRGRFERMLRYVSRDDYQRWQQPLRGVRRGVLPARPSGGRWACGHPVQDCLG